MLNTFWINLKGGFVNKFFLIPVIIFCMIVACFSTAEAALLGTSSNEGGATEAVFIVSNTCACCLNLKRENFSQKFKDKYDGILTLKEYEIHTKEGQKQAKNYTIRAYPSLFIGKTSVKASCYTEEMFREIDKVLPKHQKASAAPNKAPQETSIMSITLETGELKGIAPENDLLQMHKYLERVQENNGHTLESIASMFSSNVFAKAMKLIDANEKKLKNLATKSPSFQSFKKNATQIEAAQQQRLNKLLQENMKSK